MKKNYFGIVIISFILFLTGMWLSLTKSDSFEWRGVDILCICMSLTLAIIYGAKINQGKPLYLKDFKKGTTIKIIAELPPVLCTGEEKTTNLVEEVKWRVFVFVFQGHENETFIVRLKTTEAYRLRIDSDYVLSENGKLVKFGT